MSGDSDPRIAAGVHADLHEARAEWMAEYGHLSPDERLRLRVEGGDG